MTAALKAVRHDDLATWAVGGAVRDCATGAAVRDLDLAVAGTSDDVLRLARSVAAVLPDASAVTTADFGTATIVLGDAQLDLAPLRTERYARPGALPCVQFGASIEQDLTRRDFSVNAVALALHGADAGQLVDPYGGLDDLARRRFRVLHDRSFEDDATRIWRGARVAAQHRLRPDRDTDRLIRDGVRWMETISGTRLLAELAHGAARPYLFRFLVTLDEWGALVATHPALRLRDDGRDALRHRRGPLTVEALLAVLLATSPNPNGALDRLGVQRAVREAVDGARLLLRVGDTMAGAPDHTQLISLEGTSAAARTAALWLRRDSQRRLQRELRRWERTASPLDGDDLLELGVPRGPAIGKWLRSLRSARFEGKLSSAAAARRSVRAALRESAGQSHDR